MGQIRERKKQNIVGKELKYVSVHYEIAKECSWFRNGAELLPKSLLSLFTLWAGALLCMLSQTAWPE